MTRTLPARRLSVEGLEERAVPAAFDLAIDGNAATAQVSTMSSGGTTTFTPTGPAATLAVADLVTALEAGDVVVTTAPAAAGGGNILWVWDDEADDLLYTGSGVRTLTLRPDAAAPVGDVVLNGPHLTFADNVRLVVDTTAPPADGSIRLVNDVRVDGTAGTALTAGTGDVVLGSASPSSMARSGDIVVTAGTLRSQQSGFVLRAEAGDVTVNAPIDLSAAGMGVRADLGAVALTGAIDGGGDLSVYAGGGASITADVGATTWLTALKFAGGAATFAGTLTADTVDVGDNVFEPAPAVLSGAGTITAEVTVNFDGVLAPGGVGATGVLTIVGDLTYLYGTYALDLGATPDLIDVTGDLTLVGGQLGSADDTGSLPTGNDFQVIAVSGAVAGAFDNAPAGTGLIVGADAVRVTNYGPAAVGVTVARVAPETDGTATGAEADGTGYTVKFTGGGELVAFLDAAGRLDVAARNTTTKTKIKVTTRANASNAGITLGRVLVLGDLADFNAPKAVLAGAFTARATSGTTGAVKALSFAETFGPITTPGAIGTFKTAGNCVTAVRAASVGKVQVGLTLGGLDPWQVTNGIGSLTAAQVAGLDVTAGFLGPVSVKGNAKADLAGDVLLSTFRLTGNDGSAKQYGLKSLSARGTVRATTFDVREGSVGAVSVGRFINSNLYVDYTPTGAFDTPAGFDSATAFRVDRFTTTATVIGDPANPLNWSFAGSRIAADAIGPVSLSGLKTADPAGPFGIKFRSVSGPVRAKTSDDAAVIPNTDLAPSGTAIANEFFFLEV